jgi:hypothetical protein
MFHLPQQCGVINHANLGHRLWCSVVLPDACRCCCHRYCVIGDGLEEEVAAGRMEWPFLRVTLLGAGVAPITAATAASLGSPVLPWAGGPAAAPLVRQLLDGSGSLGRPLPLLRPPIILNAALG